MRREPHAFFFFFWEPHAFNQPVVFRLGLWLNVSLLNSILSFHLAAITKVTQKLCFCVLTELDVAEERQVERKTE